MHGNRFGQLDGRRLQVADGWVADGFDRQQSPIQQLTVALFADEGFELNALARRVKLGVCELVYEACDVYVPTEVVVAWQLRLVAHE